ncbi:peptide chain release factor H [Reichenbachiella sp.]|uniref:peptide chain release factor H n=1 Tax=Reichenbachiella sp. TaxID=2184521 RepID=UPI003BB1CD30
MEKQNEKIIQITSGRGPAECCWVVAKVLKLLLNEANESNIESTILHREQGTENGTLFSASLKLEGKNLDSFLTNWLGTVQWIGQSKFRKYHKRKNWFVGVNELTLNQKNTFNSKDIRFEFTRSGGPGGQHVNKVSTAVRATHVPSGAVVFVSNSRSQLQNKHEAIKRMQEVLEIKSLEQDKKQVQASWQNHNELDRGNPVRIFKGTDFKPNYKNKNYKSNRKSSKQDFLRHLNE